MHRFFVFAGSRCAGDSLIRNLVPKGYFVVEGPQGSAIFNLENRRVGSFCSPLLELHVDYGPVQIVQELRNSDGVDVARVGDLRTRFVHGAEIDVNFVRNAVVFKLRSQPALEVTWQTRSDKRVVLTLDECLDAYNAHRIVDFLCLTESQVIEWFQSIPGMHLVVQGLEMRDPRLSFTTLRGYDKGATRGTWLKPLAVETPSDMGSLKCASPMVTNTTPRRSVFNDPNKVRLRNEPTSTIFDDPTPLKFPPRPLVSKAIPSDPPTQESPSQPDGYATEAPVTQICAEYFSDAVARETIANCENGGPLRLYNSSGAVSPPPMVTDISSESSDSESPCEETDALSSAESCCMNDASTKAPSPSAGSAGDCRYGTAAQEHPPITLSSTVFFMFFDESRDCHSEFRTRMRRLGYSVDRCPVYPNTLAVRNKGVVIARFHNPSLVVDLPPPEVRRLLASFEADKLSLQVGHVPSTPCRLNHEKFGPVDVEVTSRSIVFGGRVAWTCTPEKVLVLTDHPNSASVDELLAFVSWSQAHLTNWFAHVRGLKFRMIPKPWNHLMFVMAERLGYRLIAQPPVEYVFERPASGWPTGTISRGRSAVRRASATDVRRRQSVSPTAARPADVPRPPSQSGQGFRSTFPKREPAASEPPTSRHAAASTGGWYYLFGDPAVLQEDVKAAFLESGLQIAGGSILRGGAPVGSFDGFCLHLSEPRRERAEIVATLSEVEVEVSQVPTAGFQYADSVRVSLDHGCRQATFSMNSSRAVWKWNSARQASLVEAETTETGEWMLLLEYCEGIIAGWFGRVTG
ncbi:MAG: uncharacterized protein KVP18_003887 [Porospora cf. gigantea A]|uniref:uncharacterized protein n=1 Tax=Porospora cf. gigantea A TaxID=2853593 RepID=UPI0035599670|nr:MAG: hypothetical protein KVP18_003887 [Porospora cf. gigantea A]